MRFSLLVVNDLLKKGRYELVKIWSTDRQIDYYCNINSIENFHWCTLSSSLLKVEKRLILSTILESLGGRGYKIVVQWNWFPSRLLDLLAFRQQQQFGCWVSYQKMPSVKSPLLFMLAIPFILLQQQAESVPLGIKKHYFLQSFWIDFF